MSERAAARHFGISRDSVRKMLSFSVPPWYRRTTAIRCPKLDGFTEIIDAWLVDDRGRNRKQRHTTKRVFERLRSEHGFTGGYLRLIRQRMAEWCEEQRPFLGIFEADESYFGPRRKKGRRGRSRGSKVVVLGIFERAGRSVARSCQMPQAVHYRE